ncbi:MAG: AbrB/MazE/SpoVT family DNA-binding domain-containing protein [Candidatus Nanoarchaeia archaeon]
MKKYPKVVQCDSRGQIVIPKNVRQKLDIGEGSAFYMYVVTDEGILLKKLPEGSLKEDDEVLKEIKDKSDKVEISEDKINKTIEDYKDTDTDMEEL